MLSTQRVYEMGETKNGRCYLVERLWPRGIRKEALQVDGWLKDVAPSTELRQWFGHDPAKWAEFRRRYFAELDRVPQTWQPLIEAAQRGAVTLVYSAHDTEHNNAVALREYLEKHLHTRPATARAATPQRRRQHKVGAA
jgi:uncharacterized protein YeaO (DUF488 family)